MRATDFEYDGQRLSDFGFIVCDFNSSSSAETVGSGADITFNTVSKNYGKEYSLVSTEYSDCLKSSFDICKNDEVYDDLEITKAEFREISRWLNRHEFCELLIIDEDDDCEEPVFFNASFNISKIFVAKKLVGIHLEAVTDKPFGYGEEVEISWTSEVDGEYIVTDQSDEIGFLLPELTVELLASGDLTLKNTLNSSSFVVKNCESGEKIHIDPKTYVISSSISSHDIANDFNYTFLKIGNTYEERGNTIKSNLKCNITLTYRPIIKDTID